MEAGSMCRYSYLCLHGGGKAVQVQLPVSGWRWEGCANIFKVKVLEIQPSDDIPVFTL